MNNYEKIEALILKYLRQNLTVDEQLELDDWMAASERNKKLFEDMTHEGAFGEELGKIYAVEKEQAWQRIVSTIQQPDPRIDAVEQRSLIHSRFWSRAAAAAVMLGVLFTAYYWWIHPISNKHKMPTPIVDNTTKNEAPSVSRAMIKLADGTTVYLDSLGTGRQQKFDDITVRKTLKDEIEYTIGKNVAASAANNFIFNPKGSRVLTITLPDGTKVQLNNETTLQIPANFSRSERRLVLEGEAYFEVAKNAAMPFVVSTGSMQIKVTGTHFNVNAYPNEAILTSLLEGGVTIAAATQQEVHIKPGQQAIYHAGANAPVKVRNDVKMDDVVAWKQGWFMFDQLPLSEIMKQIGRWYNKNIELKSQFSAEKFGGSISRNAPLADVLKMLEAYGVEFEIKNDTIIIKPKS